MSELTNVTTGIEGTGSPLSEADVASKLAVSVSHFYGRDPYQCYKITDR